MNEETQQLAEVMQMELGENRESIDLSLLPPSINNCPALCSLETVSNRLWRSEGSQPVETGDGDRERLSVLMGC